MNKTRRTILRALPAAPLAGLSAMAMSTTPDKEENSAIITRISYKEVTLDDEAAQAIRSGLGVLELVIDRRIEAELMKHIEDRYSGDLEYATENKEMLREIRKLLDPNDERRNTANIKYTL